MQYKQIFLGPLFIIQASLLTTPHTETPSFYI